MLLAWHVRKGSHKFEFTLKDKQRTLEVRYIFVMREGMSVHFCDLGRLKAGNICRYQRSLKEG